MRGRKATNFYIFWPPGHASINKKERPYLNGHRSTVSLKNTCGVGDNLPSAISFFDTYKKKKKTLFKKRAQKLKRPVYLIKLKYFFPCF